MAQPRGVVAWFVLRKNQCGRRNKAATISEACRDSQASLVKEAAGFESNIFLSASLLSKTEKGF